MFNIMVVVFFGPMRNNYYFCLILTPKPIRSNSVMEMPKQFDNLNSKVVDDLKITLRKSSKGRGGVLRG